MVIGEFLLVIEISGLWRRFFYEKLVYEIYKIHVVGNLKCLVLLYNY